MKFSNFLRKPLLLLAGILVATVVAETVPTTAEVKVKSFTYDGSTLAGQIYVGAIISQFIDKCNAKPIFFAYIIGQEHCLYQNSYCSLF